MDNSQIEIQIVDNSLEDNHYWKKLISMFAMVGLKFEIHCWNEETEEIKTALKFGKEKSTDWEFGTIIEGVIDEFRCIGLENRNLNLQEVKSEIYN
jgi:hypothetical protein